MTARAAARRYPLGRRDVVSGTAHLLPAIAAPGYPEIVGIEPTSVCNLRCDMCGLAAGRPASSRRPGIVSDAIFRRALDAAERVGLVCVNGTGENFTDPAFLDRLEEMDRRGIDIVFSTNGTLVTPDHAASLARLEHLSSVNVSLDSADPEVYRGIRGRDIAPALRGLAALAGEPKVRANLTVSAIVREKSLPGLEALPELLSNHGVPAVILQGLIPPPGAAPAAAGAGAGREIRFAINRLARECGARGIGVRVVPYLSWIARGEAPGIWSEFPSRLGVDEQGIGRRLPWTRQCGAPWEHASIDKDGRVFPCCLSPDRGLDAVVGDLRVETFDEVWNGELFRRFRLSLLAGDLPEACRSCPATSIGPHFFALYGARLVPDVEAPAEDAFRVVVENVGGAAWTRTTKVLIGTTRRRDRASRLYHDSWAAPHRAGTFSEEVVPPGGTATFDVKVAPGGPDCGANETFQLLVDAVCWLPGTEFAVERVDGTLRARRLDAGLPRAATPQALS